MNPTSYILYSTLTDFGDSALLMPVAGLFTLWMVFERAWRALGWWLVLFGGGATLVGLTKVAFLGWGVGIEAIDFTGFSGHTMFSSTIYPALLVWMSQRRGIKVQAVAWLLGVLFALAIGVSRVVLHLHSQSEVLGGFMLGTSISLAWVWTSGRDLRAHPYQFVALLAIALVMGSAHGHHARTQNMITRVALALSGRTVPYTRNSAWPDRYQKRNANPTQQVLLTPPAAVPQGMTGLVARHA
ncbi:phosphatase PAP2 family protein [Amantichitinum ursilacus]|uniref:PAP2 superfamily protein n=1 Tax=Amantichitinum ursilacus TaxID=857265 RepID=A0A0N0GRA6_9NEIS|nr:phosphatase PAP2 family protein [Amantichitinum ursilacus]KPC55249.1 PAP2 superfamily protein [Amantichitinum ursilacus]